MQQMFTCENGVQFSLDDCISVTVLRPNEVQMLFDDDGITYYAKVQTVGRQHVPPDCYNIVREDYDRLTEERKKDMFKCGNGDMFSLDACISKSVLGPEAVENYLEEEGVTYYAELFITDVLKTCMFRHNITRDEYDRLSNVYKDPIFENRI